VKSGREKPGFLEKVLGILGFLSFKGFQLF